MLVQNKKSTSNIEAKVSYKKPILGFEFEVPKGYQKIVEVDETEINMNYAKFMYFTPLWIRGCHCL